MRWFLVFSDMLEKKGIPPQSLDDIKLCLSQKFLCLNEDKTASILFGESTLGRSLLHGGRP